MSLLAYRLANCCSDNPTPYIYNYDNSKSTPHFKWAVLDSILSVAAIAVIAALVHPLAILIIAVAAITLFVARPALMHALTNDNVVIGIRNGNVHLGPAGHRHNHKIDQKIAKLKQQLSYTGCYFDRQAIVAEMNQLHRQKYFT